MLKSPESRKIVDSVLYGFDVQLRKTRWFSRSYGLGWDWRRWTQANVNMVSGKLRISETTGTYQISPFSIELRGFTQFVVDGIDDDGQRRSLIVRFANVSDSWKFAEFVPGLRWTYWDPTGRLEVIPIKNKPYRRTYEWVLTTVAVVAMAGFVLWATFNPLFTGIFGLFLLFPSHLVSIPLNRKNQQRKKGNVLVESGKVVITIGNMVWFDPELSHRRAWSPKRLLVRTGKTTLQIEFANKSEAENGLRLIQKSHHGILSLADLAQSA